MFSIGNISPSPYRRTLARAGTSWVVVIRTFTQFFLEGRNKERKEKGEPIQDVTFRSKPFKINLKGPGNDICSMSMFSYCSNYLRFTYFPY